MERMVSLPMIMRAEESYNDLLTRLELWADELAERGPDGLPEVLREMFEYVEVKQGKHYCEPCIDFNHQKNYE